jgi:hypothetical protein
MGGLPLAAGTAANQVITALPVGETLVFTLDRFPLREGAEHLRRTVEAFLFLESL